MMFTSYRIMLILCLVVIITGCLLPWGCGGDLITICDNGIVISFQYGFHFENNGGIFVIFLSLMAIGLTYFEPYFLKSSLYWALISSVILLIYTTINLGYWIMRGIRESGIIGASSPAVGLGLILFGSIASLFLTINRLQVKNS